MVTDYIKAARLEERSHSTFKNDIHYLANVYQFAIQQGYLETSINPSNTSQSKISGKASSPIYFSDAQRTYGSFANGYRFKTTY